MTSAVAVSADPVAEAELDLERIRAAVVAAEEAMESARGDSWAAAKAVESADEIEGAVALGEVDAADVARARAEAVTGQAEATETYQRQRAALQALRTRIPVAERAVGEAKLAQITGALEPAGERRREASVKYARSVKALAAAGVSLVEIRSEVDELEQQAATIAQKLEVDAPSAADEAVWPVDDLPALVKILEGGPCTPSADRERREAETARGHAEWEEKVVRIAAHEVAMGNDSALDPLPERLHEAALEKAHELYDEKNRALIAEDDRNRAALRELGAEGIETTPMAEQIADQEAELVSQAADWLADHGIDENAPALRRVPPWLRPDAIAKAQGIRRDRLRAFEQRQAELRAEAIS